MINQKNAHQKGFTLIEVIITIIIVALAGTVIFTYLGNVLTRSHEPIALVRDLAEAKEDMEELVADYQRYFRGNITWSEFVSIVDDSNVQKTELHGSSGTEFEDVDFEVLGITVTRGDQSVFALFTE